MLVTNKTIILTSQTPYAIVGGEMSRKSSEKKLPLPSNASVLLDDAEVTFSLYLIDGNNYIRLRDVGQAFNFGVTWDSVKRIIMIDTKSEYK